MTSSFVAICCFAGFVVLGATQSLYGPAIPAFLAQFHVGDEAAATPLAAHFIGGGVGVLLFARARRVASIKLLVTASYVVMGAGAVGFAASPDWAGCIASAAVLGLGFGGIDYGLNDLAASDRSPRGTARLNVLNACFGVGAIGGPWLLGELGDASYPVVFVACAVLVVVLAVATVIRFPSTAREGASAPPATLSMRSAWAVVIAFVVFYVILVGVETGVGGWEPTHLIGLGYGSASADRATAGFWFALTAGRLLVVPLVRRMTPQLLVTGCFAGMALALLAALLAPLAPASYLVVGLFMAPIFPTGLSWLVDVAPGIRGAMAYVFAASMLGGVIVPPALGVAIHLVGAAWLPVCLAGLSAAGTMICAGLMLSLRQPPRERLATR